MKAHRTTLKIGAVFNCKNCGATKLMKKSVMGQIQYQMNITLEEYMNSYARKYDICCNAPAYEQSTMSGAV